MSLNIPKKISELPSTISLAPTDLFVRVGDGGVTSKLTLLKLQDYLETSDTFVTGGTFNTVTDNIDFVGTNSFPPFSVSLSSLSPSSNVGNLIFVIVFMVMILLVNLMILVNHFQHIPQRLFPQLLTI